MKKPKIRFKGYQEDDWEQRKLVDLRWISVTTKK